MPNPIELLEQRQLRSDIPQFKAGDTVRVHFRVIEGQRSRIQVFEGIVIKRQGSGVRETFTVRKQSFGVGVERTFPVHSPKVEMALVVVLVLKEKAEIVARNGGELRSERTHDARAVGDPAQPLRAGAAPEPGAAVTARRCSPATATGASTATGRPRTSTTWCHDRGAARTRGKTWWRRAARATPARRTGSSPRPASASARQPREPHAHLWLAATAGSIDPAWEPFLPPPLLAWRPLTPAPLSERRRATRPARRVSRRRSGAPETGGVVVGRRVGERGVGCHEVGWSGAKWWASGVSGEVTGWLVGWQVVDEGRK